MVGGFVTLFWLASPHCVAHCKWCGLFSFLSSGCLCVFWLVLASSRDGWGFESHAIIKQLAITMIIESDIWCISGNPCSHNIMHRGCKVKHPHLQHRCQRLHFRYWVSFSRLKLSKPCSVSRCMALRYRLVAWIYSKKVITPSFTGKSIATLQEH